MRSLQHVRLLKTLPASFADLAEMFPRIGDHFKRTMEQSNFGYIKTPEFQRIKQKLMTLQFVLDNCDDLSEEQRQQLIFLIMSGGTRKHPGFGKAKEFLDTIVRKSEGETQSSSRWSLLTWFQTADQVSSPAQQMLQQALELTKQTSDTDFLSGAEQLSSLGDPVHAAVVKAVELAQTYFDEMATKTLKKVVDNVFDIQKDDLFKHVQREASNREQKAAAMTRQNFLRTIEEKSLLQGQR